MTCSPTFQNLCCELVEENYGDFYRTLFESLAFNGRLTAPQVAQKCHLPLRQARSGLAALIQLRLVNHHTFKDSPAIYSANLPNAYQILRTGRLIHAAREQHGETAAELIALLCELGFSTIAELRDRFMRLHDDNNSHRPKAVERTIQSLIDNNFLLMQRKAHFHEPHDAKRDIELSLMSPAALARLTGTKAKLEHNEVINDRYRQAVDTGFPEHGYVNKNFDAVSIVRHVNGDHDISTGGHAMQASSLVQPNYHKIVIACKIAAAQEFTKRGQSRISSTVVAHMFLQVVAPDVWSEVGWPSICRLDMWRLHTNIVADIRRKSHTGLPNGVSTLNGHKDEDADDAFEMEIGDIERELSLLKEGPLRFISFSESAWVVDSGAIETWLQQAEILRVMDSRLDATAARIVRILIDKGMLEERTLQEIALLGAKELRQSLSRLKQMGYLDLQEIPRDAHRLPNKTVFLWRHDAGRVADLIVENIYTGILRLMQMLKVERDSLAGTLEKVERDDVKGREEEMLPSGELTVLKRFRRLEEWIWGEVQRLDSTVAILAH